MIKNYLKIAFKVLGRRKFFTFVSLFGISLTLLVLMVATALLDQVLAPRMPEVRSDRTLGVYRLQMMGPDWSSGTNPGYGFLDRYVRPMAKLPFVERVALMSNAEPAISYLNGRKIESLMRRADGEYWKILGFDFVEGGPFTEADDRNRSFVAVISETTRDRFFGSGPAVGRTLETNGQRFRVVGVVRDVPALRLTSYGDLWVPISTEKSQGYREEWQGHYNALILGRDRAALPQIKAEFQAQLREAEKHLPDPKHFKTLGAGADTMFEAAARLYLPPGGSFEKPAGRLWIALLVATLAFMLLPTINLVNINLSRILDRSSEIGVRRAFGASSRSLVGQFLIENLVLTLIGAAIGLVLAVGVLQALNTSGVIPHSHLEVNFRVFFYSLVLALFFGVFSGVIPAWRMSKLHPVKALRGRSA
jgi:putative ABC transport system permease protein